jgi:NADPH2:quinone reductase
MKVLILGATGLVGRNALAQALARPAVTKVIAPTRNPLPKQDKLMNPVAPKLELLLPEVASWGADAAICRGQDGAVTAIGGSVGNAVTQIAKAQGAKHAISTTTNHLKAQQARSLGFVEVIDLSVEKLSDGVRRITRGYGADIVIDAMGAEMSEALGTLSIGGNLTTLGYAAGCKTTIDVTDLIWKRASMKSSSLFSQPAEVWTTAWSVIFLLLQSGAVKPIVAKTFPLAQAADALRHLVEGRPFGRVVLTI